MAKKLVQRVYGSMTAEPPVEPLTEREQQVLRLAAKGMANRQIVAELAISDRTAQGHLPNIYKMRHVSTRIELCSPLSEPSGSLPSE